MGKDTTSLYGAKQISKTTAKDISSASSLAFSTNLASLISTASSHQRSPAGRPRANNDKSDIFFAHNKNVRKRSAADVVESDEQVHKTKDDLGAVDSATLHRSKRRMEEKARIYAAMRRGEYIGSGNGREERSLVDFDRKWAEQDVHGAHFEVESSTSAYSESDDAEELVEYVDEFSRKRLGTKAEAAREERRRMAQSNAAKEREEFSARPRAPQNLIYGDAVQHQAFNPDQAIADRMADIAQKRDRSATPPGESHYDASAEVRTKGTGFYRFSQDQEMRKQEMDALEKERAKTEQARKAADARKDVRRKELEERRKVISDRRGKAQANSFLDKLEIDIG
jgi:hypothetical protein